MSPNRLPTQLVLHVKYDLRKAYKQAKKVVFLQGDTIMACKTSQKGGNHMNAELTELIFILDRSGSMGGLEADIIKYVYKRQGYLGCF